MTLPPAQDGVQRLRPRQHLGHHDGDQRPADHRCGPAPDACEIGVLAAQVAGASAVVASVTLPPTQTGVAVYDLAGIWDAATISTAQDIADGIRRPDAGPARDRLLPERRLRRLRPNLRGRRAPDHEHLGRGPGRRRRRARRAVRHELRQHGTRADLPCTRARVSRTCISIRMRRRSIINDDMKPLAKDGDLNGALLAGLAQGRPRHPAERQSGPRGPAVHQRAAGRAPARWRRHRARRCSCERGGQRGRDARVVLIDDSVLLPAPPPGLTPALATVLRADKVEREAFTSALVDLGHRGLVTFNESAGFAGLGKHVDLVVPPSPSSIRTPSKHVAARSARPRTRSPTRSPRSRSMAS